VERGIELSTALASCGETRLRPSPSSVLSVPSVVKSSAPVLDLLYPLINDPDLINDPVAQPFLAVRRAPKSCHPERSEGPAFSLFGCHPERALRLLQCDEGSAFRP
jgi:hypothetical protein